MLQIQTIQPDQLPLLKMMFREYNDLLGFDLEYQNFEEELAKLPGKYAPPKGNLLLATWQNEPAGCVGYYPLSSTICEMKRLYVRSSFQGHGIGKALLEYVLAETTQKGYEHLRLDSLKRLEGAGKLYEKYPFYPIPPYNQSPFDDAYYLELDLQVVTNAI